MIAQTALCFARALPPVLALEGGKVNNPKDPGGRTNKGITQRVYDGWRSKANLPERDVYDIDAAEVEAIYRFQYWDAIKGDFLPEGVSLVVFDGAVNSGPKQSIKWLQRALGAAYGGKVDGVMGAVTIDAVMGVNDHDALIARIIERREAFLKALGTFAVFGKGWLARLGSVRATGQAWARGSVGPNVYFVANGNAKASIEDAKRAPGKGAADGATGGGVSAGGIALAIDRAQEQLTPYSAAGGWIQTLVVGLIVAGAALTIGGLLYRLYASKKAARLADALDADAVAA